mmetsp:Transcript_27361/g.73969  ORF Transcript_27361/g.73969 Transcript_27361/m.73969 type:complete len:287 (+) Transcript_27361:174-1034(+)
MQVQRIEKGVRPGPANVPHGAFNWATIHQFEDKESGRIKCCCIDGLDIYTGSQTDGVRRWNVANGSCELFLPHSVCPDPIHALCVVGRLLWVCTGNNANAGTVVIFDLDTATIKTKAFAAHKGEITCMVAGPGNQYIVTGGVDFQVKCWSPSGTPLVTSNHHNKQVDALLMTPLTPGGSTERSGKIWTAANDSTVVVWPDTAGTGNMDASKAKIIDVEGGQCVRSMALSGAHVWCGCNNGQVCIYATADSLCRPWNCQRLGCHPACGLLARRFAFSPLLNPPSCGP